MIVVDTNIIAYLFLDGDGSELAEQVYQRDSAWAAPLLWKSELRNVLALYLRKKILSYNNVVNIMEKAEQLLNGNEFEVDASEILHLVQHSDCSAYDCEFVALAKKLNMPLITEDKKILKAFPKYTIAMNDFCQTGGRQ